MKYLLIYHDKWGSVVMGKYVSYGVALLEMLKARIWHEQHYSCNLVRFEIKEVTYE